MKNIHILTAAAALLLLHGCKNNILMDYQGDAILYFASDISSLYQSETEFNRNALKDSMKTYTFYYDEPSVTTTDVTFDLYAAGGPRDYDRPFRLEQIMEAEGDNAVPGVNYEAFDSEQMQGVYVMKAGQTHMELPIRIKRNDALNEFVLRFRLVENEHFKLGQEEYLWRKLLFTSALQRPTKWTDQYAEYYFGTYSYTKHAWMIEETGFRWDNDFLDTLLSETDAFYFWLGKLKARVAEINRQREAEGLGPWLDENGEPIALGKYA